jgi:SecD/SecF fusion protein
MDLGDLRLTFDDAGVDRLNDFIAAGNGKLLVAALDGEVVRVLRFTAPLRNGTLSIGPMDKTVAKNLARVMRSGPLPTDVSLVEERTIGADLGDDYARSGLMATVAAVLVVAVFMILSYGFAGLLADIALAANIALLLAVLSLAGFAGLVLTVGISVDGAILIYERIREDRRNGHMLSRAFASGFTRAAGTIVDANVTILIAALVLFLLGGRPVHGFALTVTAGILTSLFTTLVFMRLLVNLFHPRDIPARLLRVIPART